MEVVGSWAAKHLMLRKIAQTYQTHAVHFHCMLRELMCHGQKITGDLDGVFERQSVVGCHAADQALAHT